MTPACRVIIDGRDVSSNLAGGDGVMSSLVLEDNDGVQADRLDIEIDNREFHTAPPIGAVIEVWLGYEPTPIYMGKFTVDEWSKRGPRSLLKVTARSAELTTDIRAAKTKQWHATTVGQIANTIAAAHKLTAVVDSKIASVAIGHMDQTTESDLAFMARIAKRSGAIFKLADGKMILSFRGGSSLASGTEKKPVEITPDMVGDWAATTQTRGDYGSVKTLWHDHKAGMRKLETHGSGGKTHRDRRVYHTQREAKAAAEAQYIELSQGKLQIEIGEAPGLPTVFAGGDITMKGFDPDVDGTYEVKSVTHNLSKAGFTTSINAQSKGLPD